MFERYTELARRAVFFSRYEASAFGSPYIEVEHMLAGILRESAAVRELLPPGAIASLRKIIPTLGEKTSTSVDLPLSTEATRMLAFAADEATLLEHTHIDCGHLFAGLVKCQPSLAHAFLIEQCGDLDLLLQKVRKRLKSDDAAASAKRVSNEFPFQSWVPATEFLDLHRRVAGMLRHTFENLDCDSEAVGIGKLRRLPWTRKQALGKLIIWTDQYHLWVTEALTEPLLRATHFPSDDWVVAQRYEELDWKFITGSWFHGGSLLLHAIAVVPGAKASLPCRIGLDEPVTLHKLIERYVEMTEDILEQVLAKL